MTAALLGSGAAAAGTSGTATRSVILPATIPTGSILIIASGQSTGSATASLSGTANGATTLLGPTYFGVKLGMYVWTIDVGPADQGATLTVTWTATGKCCSLAFAAFSGATNPVVGSAQVVTGGSGNAGSVTDQGSYAIEMAVARAATEASGPVITFSSPFQTGSVNAESAISATGVQGSIRLGQDISAASGITLSTSPTAECYISAAVSLADAGAGAAFIVTTTDNAVPTDSAAVDEAKNPVDSAGSTDTSSVVRFRGIGQADSAGATDSTSVVASQRITVVDSAGSTSSHVIVRTGLTSLSPVDLAGSRDSAVYTRSLASLDDVGSRDAPGVVHDIYETVTAKTVWESEPPPKWRYLVMRLNGAGGQTWLDLDLPLTANPTITTAISGAGSMTATVAAHVVERNAADGRPILEPWSTAVFAEAAGEIRGGGLLTEVTWDRVGKTASITCTGISGYMFDMTYTDSQYWVQVDPLDVFRHAWTHMQSKWRGNLGVTLDATTSPVRIGTPAEQVEFTTGAGENVSFEAGPYKLTWWKTDDIGGEMTKLAESTPFDWREKVSWSADHRTLDFHLELGYPRLGGRRADLRFAVGENITAKPAEANLGDDYSDEVTVVGAGDGAAAQHGWAARPNETRLRRAVTLVDRTLESIRASNARASTELDLRLGVPDIASIDVTDSINAPLGSWQDGDDILVQLDTWSDWFRVTSTAYSPGDDKATLTLKRVSGVR